MNCPNCNSNNVTKRGNRRLLNTWKQTYFCKECGKRFTPIVEREEHIEQVGPRILCLDIETLPMKVEMLTFNRKVEYIAAKNIKVPTILLSWSAGWMNETTIIGDVLTPQETIRHDDSRLCKGIYDLLCKADLVVAYNGDMFDFKKLNYRFLVNNFQPPSEYRTIDPYRSLKSQFGFDSNGMNFTSELLGIDGKTETNFKLWEDCYNGDRKALKDMLTYNKNDVRDLKDFYIRIRPWMKLHPNLGVYFETEKEVCRICGGTQLREVLDKYHHTNLGQYPLYRCQECGAESVGRSNELSKEKRRSLVK